MPTQEISWVKDKSDEYLENTIKSARFTRNMYRGFAIIGRLYKTVVTPAACIGAGNLWVEGHEGDAWFVGGLAVGSLLFGFWADEFGVDGMQDTDGARLEAGQELFERSVSRYLDLITDDQVDRSSISAVDLVAASVPDLTSANIEQ